jgi:hypothetical protein
VDSSSLDTGIKSNFVISAVRGEEERKRKRKYLHMTKMKMTKKKPMMNFGVNVLHSLFLQLLDLTQVF